MPGKRREREGIVSKLRRVEVPQGQGRLIADVVRPIGRRHSAGWQVRAGIHMGPVIGGIIVKRNFSFDI